MKKKKEGLFEKKRGKNGAGSKKEKEKMRGRHNFVERKKKALGEKGKIKTKGGVKGAPPKWERGSANEAKKF